jgi:ubiquinone/menaquinone biosynthesis C-methylase UbiE
MDKPMPGFIFKVMSFIFRIRDIFVSPEGILKETEIRPGLFILDFGCGPGSHSISAAQLVETSGKVYALDIHPLAVQSVLHRASKLSLTNVETICSDCATGLPDKSIDIVLLYDAFHLINNPYVILEELYRILKLDGILSFSDHHMKDAQIRSRIAENGLFRLAKKGKRTYTFLKEG